MSGGKVHESWRFRGKGWVSRGGRAWRARDTQGEIGRGKEEKSVLTERVAEGGVRVLLDGGVVLDDALDLDEGGVVLATLLWLNEHRLPVARRGLEAVPAPLLDLANEAHLAAHVPLHDVKVHPRGRLAAVHSALHLVARAARGLGHRRTSFYCSSRFPHAGCFGRCVLAPPLVFPPFPPELTSLAEN